MSKSRFPSESDLQLRRLKDQLCVIRDKEVAAALGMSPVALSARIKRNSFPKDKLFALALKSPELDIDVDWVLSGMYASRTVALGGVHESEFEQREDLLYALEHLVPAMSDGFDIWTRGGELICASGSVAESLQNVLRVAIAKELGELAGKAEQ